MVSTVAIRVPTATVATSSPYCAIHRTRARERDRGDRHEWDHDYRDVQEQRVCGQPAVDVPDVDRDQRCREEGEREQRDIEVLPAGAPCRERPGVSCHGATLATGVTGQKVPYEPLKDAYTAATRASRRACGSRVARSGSGGRTAAERGCGDGSCHHRPCTLRGLYGHSVNVRRRIRLPFPRRWERVSISRRALTCS